MRAGRKAQFSLRHPGDGTFFIESFEKQNRMVFIPRYAYPTRRPLALVMRNYYRIKNTYLAPKPDSEGASFHVYNSR